MVCMSGAGAGMNVQVGNNNTMHVTNYGGDGRGGAAGSGAKLPVDPRITSE